MMNWNKLRSHKGFRPVMIAIIAIVLFGAGFFVGRNQEVPTKTEGRVVEDTTVNQKLIEALRVELQLREQLELTEKLLSELKVKTVERTKIVYLSDGTKIVEKDKTTELDKTTDSTKTLTGTTDVKSVITDNKTVDTEIKTHKDVKATTTSLPKDDFFIGVSGGVGLSGVGAPGVEFKYRLFDLGKASLWTGAEVLTGPPFDLSETQLRVGAGISF